MVRVVEVLALNGPELAFLGLGNEVDAFVGIREVQPVADRGWHFAVEPYMAQFGCVLGVKQEISLNQFLKQVALLLFRQTGELLLEVVPAGATPSGFVQQARCMR